MRHLRLESSPAAQSRLAQEIYEDCEKCAGSTDAPSMFSTELTGSVADPAVAVELMRLLCDERTRNSHPKVYAMAKAAILALLANSSKPGFN